MLRKPAQLYTDMATEHDSPLPVPVRIDSDTPGDVLPIPDIRLLQPHRNPRWDPASPHALARLLADISPRLSPAQSPALVTDFDDDLELSPPLDSSDDSDTPSPPDVSALIGDVPQREMTLSYAMGEESPRESGPPVDDGSEPLKQSLRGLYTLWKMSRSQKGGSTDAQDKESFMRVVEEAIGI